ncbi:hypothetical protein X737_05985 [Mesorhizobium sp. L48C026A00]|nr:hypothetical protein X737_05985 [Mesorhizobium sp. L48C026A00]
MRNAPNHVNQENKLMTMFLTPQNFAAMLA